MSFITDDRNGGAHLTRSRVADQRYAWLISMSSALLRWFQLLLANITHGVMSDLTSSCLTHAFMACKGGLGPMCVRVVTLMYSVTSVRHKSLLLSSAPARVSIIRRRRGMFFLYARIIRRHTLKALMIICHIIISI